MDKFKRNSSYGRAYAAAEKQRSRWCGPLITVTNAMITVVTGNAISGKRAIRENIAKNIAKG